MALMVLYVFSFIELGCFIYAGSSLCDILEECFFLLCCLPFSTRITISGTEVYSHGRGTS